MNIETMKQVLQAWDAYNNASDSQEDAKAHSSMVVAFAKLRTAIEQAEKQDSDGIGWLRKDGGYFNPPTVQRQWVGLTDAEIEEWDYDVRDVVMDTEKLLRDKNT
jgi:hypothetical protein